MKRELPHGKPKDWAALIYEVADEPVSAETVRKWEVRETNDIDVRTLPKVLATLVRYGVDPESVTSADATAMVLREHTADYPRNGRSWLQAELAKIEDEKLTGLERRDRIEQVLAAHRQMLLEGEHELAKGRQGLMRVEAENAGARRQTAPTLNLGEPEPPPTD